MNCVERSRAFADTNLRSHAEFPQQKGFVGNLAYSLGVRAGRREFEVRIELSLHHLEVVR